VLEELGQKDMGTVGSTSGHGWKGEDGIISDDDCEVVYDEMSEFMISGVSKGASTPSVSGFQ